MTTKTDAVGIWFYRGTVIEQTIKTLIKYTPKEIPIYVMEQSAPEMLKERERLLKAVEPYIDRITIERCFVSRERKDAPLSIIEFLKNHPEINHLFKIDDDFIVTSDAYTALREAYDSRENTIQSFLLCPMNIWGLQIFKERIPDYFDKFNKLLFNPETMYKELRRNKHYAEDIWLKILEIKNIRDYLIKGERFIELPRFEKQFSIGHCFASRDDFLAIGGIWDEPLWHKTAIETKRPRIIDTHNIIHHFAWYPQTEYLLKKIYPIIKDMEF